MEIATKAIGKVVGVEVSVSVLTRIGRKRRKKNPAFEEWQICGKKRLLELYGFRKRIRTLSELSGKRYCVR